MKALERTAYDMRIGDARHGNVTIGGRQKQGPCKPSISSEARDRGIKESAVYRFLQSFPEHKGKPPSIVCNLYERYMDERPDSLVSVAQRHGIRYPALCSFKHKYKLLDLTPEELCQRYMEQQRSIAREFEPDYSKRRR